MGGLWLVVAAAAFWVAWLLMPGVGVTDPGQIFALVSSQRSLVAGSVVLQLLSAVFYIPALLGLVGDTKLRHVRAVRWGAGLLIAGAMGSAADAVLHLLAYAMTAPDLDRTSLVSVMAFMQGPGLFLIAPLILSFFLGGAMLSLGLANAGVVSRWNFRTHGIAVGAAILGGALASSGTVPPRAVGLGFLAIVSGAQAWAGVALWKLGQSLPSSQGISQPAFGTRQGDPLRR